MCGIAGMISLRGEELPDPARRLGVMSRLIAHRGPDGDGIWVDERGVAGLAHRRLSIIDLSNSAAQPMQGPNGTTIAFNGEIYNYVELAAGLKDHWAFRTASDTETILAAYERYGDDCLTHLRGMFAFALWDAKRQRLFCARDRFGIKPFYYTVVDDILYFASEAKALLPFLPDIETDPAALAEYLTFQYTLGENTLFKGIRQLLPGHALVCENGRIRVSRYWDVNYAIDWSRNERWFSNRLSELLHDSMRMHLRSDVPVGAYLSGGVDSSLMAIMALRADTANRDMFHGRFTDYPGYDESGYAAKAAEKASGKLHIVDIAAQDFEKNIEKVIYHLDFPVAGPGSFPQFMVSEMAASKVKVVLGGQGGDEIFGGYARYLIAYFEQCIKAAIDGTYRDGNFVVTIESIIPNLGLLREYKPAISDFWREGIFGALDERYMRLIDRSTDMQDEIDWSGLDRQHVVSAFKAIFNNTANVQKEAYFDSMTHFDFKCLLPALLQVEDRMSMAHGLESRVPFLDHALVEFAATVPADVKFAGGHMKHLLKLAFSDVLPREIVQRRDKMGFPVPLKEWFDGPLRDFSFDIFKTIGQKHRPHINADAVLRNFGQARQFSRKTWGLLSLELWHQAFHDRAGAYRAMLKEYVSEGEVVQA
ncbi:asparagine synthase (glutamine-hydrolyzing) [Ferrovibrio sp.]|uniref:asparagine synthase (glutamine-hydrolyzing) n=1 Tax=Ferrovibrio sp. TaxID=1917215 RepID=UPI0035AE576F